MQKDFADLHLHTTFSDGFSTPDVVLKDANRHRLKTISITDHDTVDGLAVSISEANNYGIEVIPGIELSASVKDGEIHILGYFVDYQDMTFRKALEVVKEKRKERLKKIVNNLIADNIHVNFDSLLKFAGPGTVGRLHLARFLYRNNLVNNVYEAFDRYIGFDKPAYEKVDAFTPQETIELILNAGGIPVLAHPEPERFDGLIFSLISMGLKGIEVFHPKIDKKEASYYLSVARKDNLLVTGGSDCHGEGKLIPSMGKVKLPYEYVDKLKESVGIACSSVLSS